MCRTPSRRDLAITPAALALALAVLATGLQPAQAQSQHGDRPAGDGIYSDESIAITFAAAAGSATSRMPLPSYLGPQGPRFSARRHSGPQLPIQVWVSQQLIELDGSVVEQAEHTVDLDSHPDARPSMIFPSALLPPNRMSAPSDDSFPASTVTRPTESLGAFVVLGHSFVPAGGSPPWKSSPQASQALRLSITRPDASAVETRRDLVLFLGKATAAGQSAAADPRERLRRRRPRPQQPATPTDERAVTTPARIPAAKSKVPELTRVKPPARPIRVVPVLPPARPEAAEPLPVDLLVLLVPEQPTARQKISFTIGVPRSSSVPVERVDFYVDGRKVASAQGKNLDFTGGPYEAGALGYRAVAYDADGRSKSTSGSVTIAAAAPYGVVKGRISGNVGVVTTVTLASESRGVVAEIEPLSSGFYSIPFVPPGRYWLTVNAGKNPTITPAEQLQVTVRANQNTVQHFEVK